MSAPWEVQADAVRLRFGLAGGGLGVDDLAGLGVGDADTERDGAFGLLAAEMDAAEADAAAAAAGRDEPDDRRGNDEVADGALLPGGRDGAGRERGPLCRIHGVFGGRLDLGGGFALHDDKIGRTLPACRRGCAWMPAPTSGGRNHCEVRISFHLP